MAKKAAAEAAPVKKINAATLKEIVTLARRQIMLEELISDQEKAISALRDDLRLIQEEDLPNAMAEAGGLKKITLDSGETVEVKEDFAVGIPAPRREEAYEWFEARGFGGLIGTELRVVFGKGELSKAQALALVLEKKKLQCAITRGIHWQTLKAFVVEQTKQAKNIPLDLFGAYPTNKAVVKLPKSKG